MGAERKKSYPSGTQGPERRIECCTQRGVIFVGSSPTWVILITQLVWWIVKEKQSLSLLVLGFSIVNANVLQKSDHWPKERV